VREGGEKAGEGEISWIVKVVVQVQSQQVDKLGGKAEGHVIVITARYEAGQH
jgi:hypothetical protein